MHIPLSHQGRPSNNVHVDQDQMASSTESSLFVIQYMNLYQQSGLEVLKWGLCFHGEIRKNSLDTPHT